MSGGNLSGQQIPVQKLVFNLASWQKFGVQLNPQAFLFFEKKKSNRVDQPENLPILLATNSVFLSLSAATVLPQLISVQAVRPLTHPSPWLTHTPIPRHGVLRLRIKPYPRLCESA